MSLFPKIKLFLLAPLPPPDGSRAASAVRRVIHLWSYNVSFLEGRNSTPASLYGANQVATATVGVASKATDAAVSSS